MLSEVDQIIIEAFDQHISIENVDPHAGQCNVLASRRRLRLRWLLVEVDDAEFVVQGHHAVFRCYLDGHFDAADRHVGGACHMLGEQPRVVHLVDVISCEDQDVLRRVAAQDIEVLIDRVGGAPVPVAGHALLRRQQLDELAETAVEKAPTALHMAD